MKTTLPETHFAVWHTLQSLEDGQRILGNELMRRCNIKERRNLYSVIEDLRNKLFFVVGSKTKNDSGYYEARTDIDVARMLDTMRKPAITQLDLADKMENEWLKRNHCHELEGDDRE